MPTTLAELFPGKLGRMELTRVALRLRRPDLLKMSFDTPLDKTTRATLANALIQVRRG